MGGNGRPADDGLDNVGRVAAGCEGGADYGREVGKRPDGCSA